MPRLSLSHCAAIDKLFLMIETHVVICCITWVLNKLEKQTFPVRLYATEFPLYLVRFTSVIIVSYTVTTFWYPIIILKEQSPLSSSKYLTSKRQFCIVIMASYEQRSFWDSVLHKNFYSEKRVTNFCSKTNTVRLDDISLLYKAKIWVGRRLNFRATQSGLWSEDVCQENWDNCTSEIGCLSRHRDLHGAYPCHQNENRSDKKS